MKRVLSILSVIFMLAVMFPAQSPAPGTTTTIPEATIGPATGSSTTCPEVETQCPVSETSCPATVTECVQKETQCPAPITECVVKPTECPAEVTACIQQPTYCPMTDCGGEGCTPGYWKQDQHFDSWVGTGYDPDDLFSSVFEDAFPGMTLLEVLWQGGGGLNALGRHTVAALLNAASGDVDYDLNVQDVINLFNGVYPGGDYFSAKNVLEDFNEQGCPLN